MGLENISVRFDQKTLDRLERLKKYVATEITLKSTPTRSDVLRTVILKGLRQLETEHDVLYGSTTKVQPPSCL